jgi:hypothetical protein
MFNIFSNISQFIYRLLNLDNGFINIDLLHVPIISLTLFILTLILVLIQYKKNDENYIQKKTKNNGYLLQLFDLLGINSLLYNSLIYILYFIFTYLFMVIIELNIGNIAMIYFVLILIGFNIGIKNISALTCYNRTSIPTNNLFNCCGSFIFWPALGFVLYLIQNCFDNMIYKGMAITTIPIIYGILVYTDKKLYSNNNLCFGFSWHSLIFILGVLSGKVLYK